MEGLIIVLGLSAFMLLLGFAAAGIGHETGYAAGWEDGVEDVIKALPEDAVRALAEMAVEDKGMQMMVDCGWK